MALLCQVPSELAPSIYAGQKFPVTAVEPARHARARPGCLAVSKNLSTLDLE